MLREYFLPLSPEKFEIYIYNLTSNFVSVYISSRVKRMRYAVFGSSAIIIWTQDGRSKAGMRKII
jgi:hypothetical protein